ncbi:MAG: hypothetical protein WBP54_01540 [Pelodictyon phaeoclathratiforme]
MAAPAVMGINVLFLFLMSGIAESEEALKKKIAAREAHESHSSPALWQAAAQIYKTSTQCTLSIR